MSVRRSSEAKSQNKVEHPNTPSQCHQGRNASVGNSLTDQFIDASKHFDIHFRSDETEYATLWQSPSGSRSISAALSSPNGKEPKLVVLHSLRNAMSASPNQGFATAPS